MLGWGLRGLVRSAPVCRGGWNRRSAGDGSKGWREYDWAWVRLDPPSGEVGGHHFLLVRRGLRDGKLAFYRCWSPRPVSLRELVAVAGRRWSIETCSQTGKGLGLDEHQVRRWGFWYRHTTLVILAHAALAVIAAHERARPVDDDGSLVPLSINEIRRLLARLALNTVHTIAHWLGWSHWRRRHQQRARTSHYHRRGQLPHRLTPT